MTARGTTLLAALLLWMSAAAQQADYSKMSALVRRAACAAHSTRRTAATEGRTPRLTAFVRLSDAADADALLDEQGCRLLAHQGDIVIASIPTDRLPALSQQPQVMRIEAGRRACTLMDTTRSVINALPAYQATARHEAFTGRGVVLGLMDVGFDLTHPNFFSTPEATGYRIRALWDQLSADTISSQLPVGREFLGEQQLLALGNSTDGRTETHGTHTLGIAAGSGFDSPYIGMAPESDICLVANAVSSDTIYIAPDDYYKYTTATDALGFQYLFDYADRQGQPCVVSFSEGYISMNDADDQLFAEYLDRLSGPGHIIVVAAGNQGHLTTYAEKTADEKQAGAFINAWEKTAHYCIQTYGDARIILYAYAGGNEMPSDTLVTDTADDRLDSLLAQTFCIGSDTCTVSLSRHIAAFGTATVFQLSLEARRPIGELPPIAIVLEGDGAAEVYGSSSCQLIGREQTDRRWTAARPGHNILAPAWLPSAICVGSTAHRLSFTNYLGERRDYSQGKHPGMIAPTSSRGPTMDGRTKPDVCAPGDNIVSSYSSFYLEANPKAGDIRSDVAHFDFRGRTYAWNSNAGTSMACPAVAGAIALWLQAKPTLTREEILDIFARTCRRPDATLSYPNNTYGWGEIDVYRGLLDILGLTTVDAISPHRQQSATIRIADGRLTMQFHTVPSHPVQVSIYSATGCRLQQWRIPSGVKEASADLPKLPEGIYAIQLTSHDIHLTGSQLVRIE